MKLSLEQTVKINEDWKEHIKKERLKKCLTFSSEALAFLKNMNIIELTKWTDERNANFGKVVFPYKIVTWEILFKTDNKNYLFYKIKRPQGEPINRIWVYKKGNLKKEDDGFLKLTIEERKGIVSLIETFSFEKYLK